MQSAARIAVSLFIVTSVVVSAHKNSAKLRRDGVMNLYPFPRVGRASNGWQLPLERLFLGENLEIKLEYKPEQQKRQLYAFPRVGRSDVPLTLQQLQQLQQLQPELLRSGQADQLRSLMDLVLGRARSHGFSKRGSESTDSTGMWFGPRLGRAFKGNDDEDVPIPSQSSDVSEPELPEPEMNEDRKKRQTK